MNWPVIIIIGILLLALVIFLVRRNVKDEKEVEAQLKDDYIKPHDEKSDGQNNEPVV